MAAGELPRNLWLGVALMAASFVALIALEGYEAYGRGPRLEQGREQVIHAFDVITTARGLDRAIQDAERGQRGYLLTGDAAYLEPYRSGAREAPLLVARLRTLTADNPELQGRLPELSRQLEIKLGELQRTVETRDREGFEAARRMVQSNTGLEAMRAIGASIDAIIASENGRLTQRLAALSDQQSRAADAALAAAVIAFAAMALGLVLALLAVRHLRHSETLRGQSEERFRLLVDGVSDYAIYTLDPRGNVTDWNAGAQRVKGYTADEIVGQHFSRFYTPEDRSANVPRLALEKALRDGKFEAEGWRLRKDGSRFWASATITPLYDRPGRLVGFAKITRDVTERREHELALEQARSALVQAQKMESLGQLSGGIAHDFNNLLHVIINCVAILERRLEGDDSDTHQYLEMVKRSAERAASLTQRMLAFARRQPLQPRPIDPNKLIAGMADLLERALGESVALETVLGAGIWLVSADANQLEAALLNLAVNARDAMPGGGKLTVETTNAFLDDAYAAMNAEISAGQYVLISVSDTGAGMTEEVAAKAFDPFFTTKGPDKGTGLGLSQVYGFIKQSGGHAKIYSEPGEGTTVKLYLPRLPAAAAEEVRRDARAAPVSAASEMILVVEDNEDVRAFTEDVLRELGYRVETAPDARAALRVLEQRSDISLLFVDVGLPNGINGRELADEVRRRWPAVKVLFTTGYARNAIVHHGRLDPGLEVIIKPFTYAALARKVKQVLDEAR